MGSINPNPSLFTFMANFDVESLLVTEANRIGPDIYRKVLNSSPWIKLIKRDVWPDEMGSAINVLTYERSLPTTALTWSAVSLDPITGLNASGGAATLNADGSYSTGNGNNAVQSAQVIQFAQTLRSYNLTQTFLESPKLSVNDLRFTLRRKEQLSNIFAILTENTSYAWQERFRDEYIRVAQNKVLGNVKSSGNLINASSDGSVFPVVVGTYSGGTFTASGTSTAFAVAASGATVPYLVTGTPAVGDAVPASVLTQGMLDRMYMKLIRDGAGTDSLGRENARPIFGVILSSEASRNLILSNPDIRQDVRWSDKVNDLLAPLGIERSYGGFFHMVDDWAPRYNLIMGTTASGVFTPGVGTGSTPTWVRVPAYAPLASTQGNRQDMNPAYESAQYEDSIVFHQNVFMNLVPKPITAPGGNTAFSPVSYMGDFKWKNIITPDTNPDGTIGYFRAVLSSGTKPIRPEWGYVIRHQRASTPLALLSVSNAIAYSTLGNSTANPDFTANA